MRGEKFDFLQPVTLKFGAVLPYQLYRIVPESKARAGVGVSASPRKNP